MSDGGRSARNWVLIGLCLIAALAYVHRACLGGVESNIRDETGLDKDQIGHAQAIFFLTYALFQIPTGMLVDRIGPRRGLFLFGLTGAAAMALSFGAGSLSAPTALGLLIAARGLMGVAQAGLFPAATRAISNWFEPTRRGSASGMLQASMSIGNVVAGLVIAELLGIARWPWLFAILAVPGVVWSFWFVSWFRDRPATASAAPTVVPRPESFEPSPAELFPWVPVILLSAQQFFRAAGNVFWLTWAVTYLKEVHQLEGTEANRLSSVPALGLIFGSLAGGLATDWVYRRTGNLRTARSGTAVVTIAVGVLSFVAAYFVPAGYVLSAAFLLLSATLWVSMSNACAYSTAMDLGGPRLATVFGAMNMCGNLGAALLSKYLPRWEREFGVEANILLVGGCYAVGLVIWLFLDPRVTTGRRE